MNPIITKVLDDINKKEFAEWEVEWINPVLNCYKSPDGTYKITKFGEILGVPLKIEDIKLIKDAIVASLENTVIKVKTQKSAEEVSRMGFNFEDVKRYLNLEDSY